MGTTHGRVQAVVFCWVQTWHFFQDINFFVFLEMAGRGDYINPPLACQFCIMMVHYHACDSIF